ncbi:MAG: hypothetical protein RLZZ401_2366 [Pseudomonadota bacterium]|jgi:predicted MFS family arabinose efflux permease
MTSNATPGAQAPISPGRERWLLLTLAGIQFTHILDFMIMMPLGPQFTQLFGISDASFGVLVSAYTFAAGASGLLASTYIDRFDRKRLLLVLYGLFALATLACGLASSYALLLTARVAAGVFGGVLSALSQTIVGDVVPFERRGRAMGVVMTSFSVSTVAGVPLGLFLAAHLGWHAPFFAIAAVCALLAVFAALTLPVLDQHLLQAARPSTWRGLQEVLMDRNHQKAFVFSASLMMTGFTVIPYITIYMQANVGLQTPEIPYLYLCGGVATLLSARWVARMTDLTGKVETFRLMGLALMVPLFAVTLMPRVRLEVALIANTLFFSCMSGRMIPGMAILTSAANPQLRGTFMTLNGAVQSASMGLAAFIGGALMSRDAHGAVENYWMNALVGAFAGLISLWIAPKLDLHQPKPATVR